MRWKGKWYTDEISERNCKFRCEKCGKEVYGKKVRFELEDRKKEVLCLPCLVKVYRNDSAKALKEIKERYKEDFVVEAL